ncbi:hypothetical protein SteCoe_6829 [Stentor coeruleus]|uniref:Uncharacterized protein n=1 Tax=Stentor coeruleus TaxID=5963 RepID=A0A1R2CP34_9CILI|nr:hypothetical protein SteCoe_6829 [Stentor coeruleus]
MIFRGFQGGFFLRKSYMWFKSMNRFRFQGLIILILFSFPFSYNTIEQVFNSIFSVFQYYALYFRPHKSIPWNLPITTMNPFNKISEFMPSQNYFSDDYDREKKLRYDIEKLKIDTYKLIHNVDIIRTSGFVHHPSRETNCIVEGEIYRSEQDKIVESMRVMMAEFGVRKGIWQNLNDAFRKNDEIKKKRMQLEIRR